MSTSLEVFNEALERASNPINPPPARPSALDMSSPSSSLDPNLAGHWHNNSQHTPPNTATETCNAHWYLPDPLINETPVSQTSINKYWAVDKASERLEQHNQSQSFAEADSDFRQQAIAFNGSSQMHNQKEHPSPVQPQTTYAGESPQSKAPAMDDLFSDVDQNEMPDFDEVDQDDNIFHMSGFGQQQTQNPIQLESNTSLQIKEGLGQTPRHPSLTDMRSFPNADSHPSPTESQLIAEGFEFHNQLPEEVQISRFNDKAFRKVLREVQSDLPRKQQWYAWSKAKQMLNSEPESAVTEQMPKGWREPLERHHEYQPRDDREMPQEKHAATELIEDGIWVPPVQPISLGTTIHGRSGSAGVEDHAVERQWVTQLQDGLTRSSPASTGGFAIGQGDRHLSKEAVSQDRLSENPLGSVIKKIAEEQRSRRTSQDEVPVLDQDRLSNKPLGPVVKKIATERRARRGSRDEFPLPDQDRLSANPLGSIIKKMAAEQQARRDSIDDSPASYQDRPTTQPVGGLIKKSAIEQPARRDRERLADASSKPLSRRDGSAHGLLPSVDVDERVMRGALPSQSRRPLSPSLPPRMTEQHSLTKRNDSDLLRPHTNTILRHSLSPSHSHSCTQISPPISPNRRSPSPWIEHPGINRPDTPRPISGPRETSPLRGSIRATVEAETPFSQRVRQNTPLYTSRSPSPSPVSHLGTSHTFSNQHAQQQDIDMTDAPSPPSSPMGTPPVPRIPQQHLPPNSSPDPLSSPPVPGGNTVTAPQHSPFRPPPIPDNTITQPKRSDKRRKSVGGQTSKAPQPSVISSAVQGSKINKGKAEPNSRTVTRKITQVAQKVSAKAKKEGSKVAQEVKRIEEGMKAAHGSPRRSGRIATRDGGWK